MGAVYCAFKASNRARRSNCGPIVHHSPSWATYATSPSVAWTMTRPGSVDTRSAPMMFKNRARASAEIHMVNDPFTKPSGAFSSPHCATSFMVTDKGCCDAVRNAAPQQSDVPRVSSALESSIFREIAHNLNAQRAKCAGVRPYDAGVRFD